MPYHFINANTNPKTDAAITEDGRVFLIREEQPIALCQVKRFFGGVGAKEVKKALKLVSEKGAESAAVQIKFPTDEFRRVGFVRELAEAATEFLETADMIIWFVMDGKKASAVDSEDLSAYLRAHYEPSEASREVLLTREPSVPAGYRAQDKGLLGESAAPDENEFLALGAQAAEECDASSLASERVTEDAHADRQEVRADGVSKNLKAKGAAKQARGIVSSIPKSVTADEMSFDEGRDVKAIDQRLDTLEEGFSDYLLRLIRQKGMTNAEVYKRAIVDKRVFSKIKNNPDYHTEKRTALCLCVGAKLGLDETKELLSRAGYSLSPANKTDVIFAYFIENGIYDMLELDIQLEEHGEKCVIV